MTITNKDMDKYFLNKFNIHKKDYDKVFSWASKNWYNMLQKGQGKNAISIADQISQTCKIPYSAAADIANSISISMAIG